MAAANSTSSPPPATCTTHTRRTRAPSCQTPSRFPHRHATAQLCAPMVYLEHSAFIVELDKLYVKNKSSGSVWITTKRVERPIVTGRKKLDDREGPQCIVRATDGKKKLACAVSAGEFVQFHMDMFTVIKANTENLQKPKRTNRKKASKTS